MDHELGQALLTRVPREWNAVIMIVERRLGLQDRDEYRLSLESPTNSPGVAIVDEALNLIVRKLFLLHRRYMTGLKGMTYTFRRRPDGRWAWTAEYQYEN